MRLQQRDLGADGIIGQAAGTQENLHPTGLHQVTQEPFGGAKISGERARPVGDGPFFKGLADFFMHVHRAG